MCAIGVQLIWNKEIKSVHMQAYNPILRLDSSQLSVIGFSGCSLRSGEEIVITIFTFHQSTKVSVRACTCTCDMSMCVREWEKVCRRGLLTCTHLNTRYSRTFLQEKDKIQISHSFYILSSSLDKHLCVSAPGGAGERLVLWEQSAGSVGRLLTESKSLTCYWRSKHVTDV